MATKEKTCPQLEFKTIPLGKISQNSGQTRGMGVCSQLQGLGYGLFERISGDEGKETPIWAMLTSEKPDERKRAVALIRDHEPDIVSAAESQGLYGQLQPIRVIELSDGTYDIIFGMTRALARAFNAAESKSAPDDIDVMVMDKIRDIDLLFLGYAENNDRRDESPIDKALFFKRIKDDNKIAPEEIGKRVGLTGQSVRDYIKLLHPKLEDKKMDIHEGKLTIDKAKKLLAKRIAGESEEGESNGQAGKKRVRMPSVKKLDVAYSAKKKPEFMDQKEWEFFITDDVRKWLCFYFGKKFKPFTGQVLTVEEPETDAAEDVKEAAKKVLKLAVPKKKAVALLVALGKPEAESWDDTTLSSKLENIVNVCEPGTKLEDEKLQSLLEKLLKGYETGIIISIKA